jgi:hypothetical protein
MLVWMSVYILQNLDVVFAIPQQLIKPAATLFKSGVAALHHVGFSHNLR